MEKFVYEGCQFPSDRQAPGVVLEELERRQRERYDVTLNSSRLEFIIVDEQVVLKIFTPGEWKLVPITENVQRQLAVWMGINLSCVFHTWIMQNPKTWISLVNDFLKAKKEQRLVRCLKNKDGQMYCRAILPEGCTPTNHVSFFRDLFALLKDDDAEIWHAMLSENCLNLYAVAPSLSRRIGEDVFNAALFATNSETTESGSCLRKAALRRSDMTYEISIAGSLTLDDNIQRTVEFIKRTLSREMLTTLVEVKGEFCGR